MSDPDYRREMRFYLAGFGLALTLTLVPFGLVYWELMQGRALAATIAVLAVAQIVVHLRFFLHIDLSSQKREDLQLILFTILLLGIMAFGTIWIMGNLATRM
ncbi:Cytochrome bo(3) ubiquinol oxidase subunit 4 [Sulfitobacter sp. THAF37]|uniref:cytochrome o ubiquinol oxidase subunit IV n=1 Tax=Sulfitobacter sp. THAF37 TaxID=2587855 RepID=UPI00126799A3|nr:cytochrome o ubiquinol oxidase subunit IV [Sulfitobacter sp. THAF37]QFT59377.1 Cytochrome bo(3) ubiquinol oxidase subunit 4 [Sulfitobacter sp. THAF37]